MIDAAKDPSTADQRRICTKNNGSATFRNFNGFPGIGDPTMQSTDLAAHDCTYPALSPVVLPNN